MNIPLGDFNRGPLGQPSCMAGQRLAPNICYEDLFGEELHRFVEPGAHHICQPQQYWLVW